VIAKGSTNRAPRRVGQLLIAEFLMLLALVCQAGTVHAEPSPDDKALASVLFQEGRSLMTENRLQEACQKFEESQRLDPGGGTLLNLALCHEQESRLARSWSEFSEAMEMARRDGRRDREVEAANHVRSLEPRLSRLTIVVPAGAQVQGLRIERDGRELGRGAWSTPIPVEGGTHVVRATAPGKQPFTATVAIANESDARTVEIPALATVVLVVTSPQVSSPAADRLPMTAAARARLRWAGIGVAGAGVVLLGTASYALATALDAKHASASDCMADVCGDTGLQQRRTAVSRGNLATLLGVSGVVLVGAGGTLFYLGTRSSTPTRDARIPVRFKVAAALGAVMTGIEGGF
jgi:hypothetical protein